MTDEHVESVGPRVVPALRGEPPDHAIQRLAAQRARQFLQSQTAILVFAVALTIIARWTGLLGIDVSRRYLAAWAVTALVTAVGWSLVRTPLSPRRLTLGLLVVNALVGYPAVYFTGGLATVAGAAILVCLPMTPLFAGKKYLLPVALLHWALYTALTFLDARGTMVAFAPDWLLPEVAGASFSHAAAAWEAFTILCGALTFLISMPSLDTALQKAVLSDEVERNTAALQRTSHKLASANADLAGVNEQLQSTNAELVTVNGDLATVVEELESVNDQLGLSNAELARTNHELAETNIALQRSNERLDQFNTAVSHDLRAPLQAMMARAELAALAAHTDPSRVARMADQICDSATRMATQLDELFKLSRLEDRLEAVEEVSLAGLLGTIAQDLEPKIRARRVNLEVVHPLPRLWGSRALLAELFQNLVDNAIKYGDAKRPRVRVTAVEGPDGMVGTAVEDNGPGIPADQRERVFKLFGRLIRDQEVEGVGAGLAIVRRIVAVHGGTVTAEAGSNLGGARFVVCLPAPPDDVSSEASPSQSSEPPRASTSVRTPGVVAEA